MAEPTGALGSLKIELTKWRAALCDSLKDGYTFSRNTSIINIETFGGVLG